MVAETREISQEIYVDMDEDGRLEITEELRIG
jgi:uncharacterized protein YuzE